jgi:hypothetical protein
LFGVELDAVGGEGFGEGGEVAVVVGHDGQYRGWAKLRIGAARRAANSPDQA